MIEFINFYLIPGLILGSIYALGAVGISLIFGLLRFAHFAHGDLMTFGAYVTLAIVGATSFSAMQALPLAVVITIGMGLFIDRYFYKPLRSQATIVTVIASFGIALALRSLVQLLWGTESAMYETGFQRPMVWFDTLRIAPRHLQIILVTAVIAIGLHFFLTRSKIGKSMRAVADDAELAAVSGLDVERITLWVWIIGGALAAVAGIFIGIDTEIHSNMGWNLLLPIFASALLGGIGKPLGAILGGFIIGLAEELAVYPWIGDEALISPGYKSAVAFTIMIALLLFRPQGLAKGRLL